MTNFFKHLTLTGLMVTAGSVYAYSSNIIVASSPFTFLDDSWHLHRRILSELQRRPIGVGIQLHDEIIEENGNKYLKVEVDGLAAHDSELVPTRSETGLEIIVKPGGKLSIYQQEELLSIRATASKTCEKQSESGLSHSEDESGASTCQGVNGQVKFAEAEEPKLVTDQGKIIVKIPFNAIASATPEPAKTPATIKTFAYNTATSTATQTK